NTLGLNVHKYYGRKTIIEKVDKLTKEIKEFSIKNSLHGHRNAKVYYLVKDKETNELLQLYSFGTPYFVKNKSINEMECIRGITKQNTSVIGGFSKVLKKLLEDYTELDSILYYVDYNTHIGNSMEVNNFIFEDYTGFGLKNLCLNKEALEKYSNENRVFNRIPSRHSEIKEDM